MLFYNEVELHKYVLTFELLGRMSKLSYKCGSLPNRTVTYSNNIYWTFQNGDVINDNEISTYNQAYASDEELGTWGQLVSPF